MIILGEKESELKKVGPLDDMAKEFLIKCKQFKFSLLYVLDNPDKYEKEDISRIYGYLTNFDELTKWLYTVKVKDKNDIEILSDLDEIDSLKTEISDMYTTLDNSDYLQAYKAIDTFCDNYPFNYSFDEFFIAGF